MKKLCATAKIRYDYPIKGWSIKTIDTIHSLVYFCIILESKSYLNDNDILMVKDNSRKNTLRGRR